MKARTRVKNKTEKAASAVIERWKKLVGAFHDEPDGFSARDYRDLAAQAALYELPAFMVMAVVPGRFKVPEDMEGWESEEYVEAVWEYALAYAKRWQDYVLGFEARDSDADPAELRRLSARVGKMAKRLFWSLYLAERGGHDVDALMNSAYLLLREEEFDPRLREVNWKKYFGVPF